MVCLASFFFTGYRLFHLNGPWCLSQVEITNVKLFPYMKPQDNEWQDKTGRQQAICSCNHAIEEKVHKTVGEVMIPENHEDLLKIWKDTFHATSRAYQGKWKGLGFYFQIWKSWIFCFLSVVERKNDPCKESLPLVNSDFFKNQSDQKYCQ